jgi:hypothetical protein
MAAPGHFVPGGVAAIHVFAVGGLKTWRTTKD